MKKRLLLVLGLMAWVAASTALAEKKYDPGASDTEIKIGQTTPYSGPASAYSTMAKAEAAYFAKINAEGGVNGRKINFISLDDGYSPPRTVEQVRKLVEQEQVLLLYHPVGTAPNTAIHRYMNAKRVPQLFVGSAASKFTDPQHYPWTMSWPGLPARVTALRKEPELPMLLPGIRINTGPTDYAPIEQVRLARFDGTRWVLFGGVLGK